MESVSSDVKYAIRILIKSPGFTLVALITLGLAIGANTAIFTLIDSLLLRPLPVHDPSRLVGLHLSRLDGRTAQVSYPTFQGLAARQQVFSGIFAWDDNGLNDFQVSQVSWHGPRLSVTGDFYTTVGVLPFMGRGITADDLHAGATPVALISYDVWKHRLGGDPAILGKTLKVQDIPFTIVGVTPPSFFGLYVGVSADVTVPVTAVGLFSLGGGKALGNASWLDVAARLKPEVSLQQAQAHLNSIWPTLLVDAASGVSEEQRGRLPTHADIEPATTGFSSLRARFSRPLFMLMGMVILVLLLVCTNLAALMLARAAARRYEMAVRIALGASRPRILRQLLTETFLLSLAGALIGMLLSFWMSRGLAKFVWTGLVPLSLNLRPDVRILTFAVSSTLLTGMVFGLVPGWRAGRHDPNLLLHHGRISGAATGGFGNLIVVTQIVFSGVLLAGAWTVVGHLRQLRAVPLGFDPGKVLLIRLLNRPGAYRNLDHAVYDRELLGRVAGISGVQSASLSQGAMLSGLEFNLPVNTPLGGTSSTTVLFGRVSPNFFRTLGMQIKWGRDFDWHDDAQSPPVAIVSASLGRELFSSDNPLGRSIRVGTQGQDATYTIVGIVSEARLGNVRNQKPMVFLPSFQKPEQIVQPLLEVRSYADPAAIAGSVRTAVESLGREYPLKTETLQSAIDEQLIPERLIAMFSSALGALAFALAVISLFGLISYNVSLRTNEIGVRVALGAGPWKVLQLVVRDVCVLVLIGETLTVPVAFVALRVIPRFLAGVHAGVAPLIASGIGLAVAAAIAAYIPARRASQVDPMVALRYE
jgi:predicted permease